MDVIVSFWTVFAVGLSWFCFLRARSLFHYIAEAKVTGSPYVILPVHPFSAAWALLHPVAVPFLCRLPTKLTERWLPLLLSERAWQNGYEPFRRNGYDTFIAVSPTGNICYNCDPQLVQHLLRSAFIDKPAKLLSILNIFGPTMTGTVNKEARLYRRIATPFFNESTMRHVWAKSLDGAQALSKVLFTKQEPGPIWELRPILARLSLYLLNAVCFESLTEPVAELQDLGELLPGHHLTYSQAMHTILDHIPTIFLVPPLLLKLSPFRKHKEAWQAYSELRRYMEELRDSKEIELDSGRSVKESTILDLVVGAGLPSKATNQPTISPAEVLGNIFIFMFAGHEANANTLTFILILLACHPSIQRRLQHDIDRVVGSSSPSSRQSWSYDAVYPLLSDSMIGAVINENLRLFTVLPFILKYIPDGTSQAFNVEDRTLTLPPGTLIFINTSALHYHPKYWTQTGRDALSEDKSNPLAAFNPDSWFCTGSGDGKPQQRATRLRRPQEGTFIPFSDGSRGCLGKKFALVELCGVVARIFKDYTVELALDGISEEQDDDLQGTERWKMARKRMEHQLSADVEFKMSLRLVGTVPLNLVKRGEETFKDI